MFQSYEYLQYVGLEYTDLDMSDKIYKYKYRIVDDEFVEDAIVDVKYTVKSSLAGWAAVAASISKSLIDIYSNRNSNVAANLVLLFKFVSRTRGASIEDIIKLNKKHNPKYSDYAEEVKKYLIWA